MNKLLKKPMHLAADRTGKAILILIIFYCVGITGFAIPALRDLFLRLTPVALLLSLAVLAFFHEGTLPLRTALVFSLIYFLSFFVEVAGVKSGMIFGPYLYGDGLGIKLLDTPLLIGMNWLLLLYCSAIIAEKLLLPDMIQPFASSLIMVLYDLVLEQVAPDLDLWTFENGVIPVRNYLAWFVLSLIFQYLIKVTGLKLSNKMAVPVFFIQLSFFIILLIIFRF